MKVIFNHYVKKRVTFTIGPAQARESLAQARPAARKIITYRPGPGPGLQVSCPHPARPVNYYRNLTRPGPAHRLRASPARGPRPGPCRTLVCSMLEIIDIVLFAGNRQSFQMYVALVGAGCLHNTEHYVDTGRFVEN